MKSVSLAKKYHSVGEKSPSYVQTCSHKTCYMALDQVHLQGTQIEEFEVTKGVLNQNP
jgi:hypothetical protein